MNDRKKDSLEFRKVKALESIARELKKMNDIHHSRIRTIPTYADYYKKVGETDRGESSSFTTSISSTEETEVDPLELLGIKTIL